MNSIHIQQQQHHPLCWLELHRAFVSLALPPSLPTSTIETVLLLFLYRTDHGQGGSWPFPLILHVLRWVISVVYLFHIRPMVLLMLCKVANLLQRRKVFVFPPCVWVCLPFFSIMWGGDGNEIRNSFLSADDFWASICQRMCEVLFVIVVGWLSDLGDVWAEEVMAMKLPLIWISIKEKRGEGRIMGNDYYLLIS